MKIKKIYIGGWFQRTILQLTEVYDFFREASSQLPLDKNELFKLHKALDIKEIKYSVDGLEFVSVSTNSDVCFKIYEDGLILLSDDEVEASSLYSELEAITEYYEKHLSPTLSYLFSLGAPIPKELANIKTVYPYFIVFDNATDKEIDEVLNAIEKQKYYKFSNDNLDIIRGEKYYFINSKRKKADQIERYVEEQIFIREFKGQLHRYLNLHRIIWEKIDSVKNSPHVKGKDILKFNSTIDGYSKTINLIDTRINQMDTYLHTREKIAKNDEDLKEFLEIMGYRYEALNDTLKYIQQLWTMTKNYVNSAKETFGDLEQRVTQKSIENLSFITSIGVGSSLMFLLSTPEITSIGLISLVVLVIAGYAIIKIMGFVYENKKYEISDINYDKDIK